LGILNFHFKNITGVISTRARCFRLVATHLPHHNFVGAAMTTCAAALKAWEAKHEASAQEATEINLCFRKPPITKLDSKALGTLKNCEKLSLSSNMIDRMVPLTGLDNLKILSIGRNNLKKIEKLEDVAGSLQQLWISYNQISSLDGLACLTNLTTLYCSNNQIKSFAELEKLKF
jgi:dynein light chain 1